MALVLTVLRGPDRAGSEQRRVAGGALVLGRGGDCDWPLQDPDRVLSKRHCAVEYLGGGWQVRDLSTNGTYVNASGEPIGRDHVQGLRDGDRLRLGAYEIECRIEAEAGIGEGRWSAPSALPDPMSSPGPDPLAGDIFAAPLPGLSPAGGTPGGHAPLLPADFDSFAPDDPGPVMPDHRPSTNDVFTPPRATMPDLLPDDWNLSGIAPAATPGPLPAAPVPDPFATGPDPFADAAPTPAAPPRLPSAPLPDPFADMPPPFAAPLPGPVPAKAAVDRSAPANPMMGPSATQGVPAPLPAPSAAPQPPGPPAPGDLQAALALVFQAAGLGAPPPSLDPYAALAAAGAGLRAAVAGMRALLIARADVKREFRIEQTMLRAAGNNPVKFAATDEAAVIALLGQAGGAAALRETVQDLTAHQVATLAATQAAARALLARLAPAPLEAQVQGGGLLPGAREKRLWEAYRKLHQEVGDQFEDDFDSAFGKAFARAYEEAARGGA